MIKEKYSTFLSLLMQNENIEVLDYLTTDADLREISPRILNNRKVALLEKGIAISDTNLEYFQFSSIRIGWRSKLEIPGMMLQGGFAMNGLTDALLFPSS